MRYGECFKSQGIYVLRGKISMAVMWWWGVAIVTKLVCR